MNKTAEFLAWIGSRIGKPPGWERVVRRLAGPEKCKAVSDLCIVRDGLAFLAQPAIPLDWNVIFFGAYEREARDIFRAVLPPGGVALDIGANVGYHTLLLASLVGPGGRVLAAEANASVRERLSANLRLNRFSQVEVVPFAVGNSDGTVEFFGPAADDADSGNGYVLANEAPEQPQRRGMKIEARRLDTIMAEARLERLDLLKIDVEGFEWPVLQGGEKAIAEFRPHIVFEYNTEYAWRGGGNPDVIAEFFRRHGYQFYTIRRNWSEAVEPGKWPSCADIWAIPNG